MELQVGLQFGSSSKLASERENQHSSVMAAMNPIDISSSDSDLTWDLDDYRESDKSPPNEYAASANPRILPSWASPLSTDAMGTDWCFLV